ncbi:MULTISPECIES: WD40 repeat domain-containing protein [Thalassotalea]|uniref:WD40 repeat domain-containing protein n=1 Tax=Thalassotalea TaxID=1518149 RepID=UPI0009443DC1|nr:MULTISPECIES: hypothetical protein [Thalassotalea]OKY25218.1 hypothetical protein BI291_03830 [Thalassotalea sp. PP2-459]
MRTYFLLLICVALSACTEQPVYTSLASVTQQYSEKVLKAADISTDGTITIVSDNEQVCVWDNIKDQKSYCLQGLDAKLIELLGISHSKRYFYTSNRVNVHLYDLATGRLVRVWSAGDNIINDIAMANNEKALIFAFRSGQASVVSVHSDVINTFKPHRLDINSIAISNDGMSAFTGSSDKYASLWHTKTGEILDSYTHQSRVNHVALSPTGKFAFTLDAIKDRFFWRINNPQPQAELGSLVKFIEFNDSQFVNHNKWLLSASPKQVIQLWRVKDGELLAQWQAYKHEQRFRSSVLAIEMINPNTIASMTSDGVYQQWPVAITSLH